MHTHLTAIRQVETLLLVTITLTESDKFLSTDMVATLGETTGLLALKKMHHKMSEDPVGQNILQ